MISRRFVLGMSATIILTGMGSRALAESRTIRTIDTDHDGTIDLAETKKAASKLVCKAGPRS